jgi:hypothetical protein
MAAYAIALILREMRAYIGDPFQGPSGMNVKKSRCSYISPLGKLPLKTGVQVLTIVWKIRHNYFSYSFTRFPEVGFKGYLILLVQSDILDPCQKRTQRSSVHIPCSLSFTRVIVDMSNLSTTP